MKILIDLIKNPHECHGGNTDHRYTVWKRIGDELIKRGHDVFYHAVNTKAINKATIRRLAPYINPGPRAKRGRHVIPRVFAKTMDLFIAFSPYGGARKKLYDYCSSKKVVTLCYEHSWLRNSVLVDPCGVFSDSKYYDSINEIVQNQDFDRTATENYRKELIDNNITKRPQGDYAQGRKGRTLDWSGVPLPEEKFIFFPGQVEKDLSIVRFSNETLLGMAEKTLQFAKKKKLHIVFKPHPWAAEGSSVHGVRNIRNYCKAREKQGGFHTVNAPIYEIMKKAEYTVCVNCGSVMDNFITQTPVFCGGQMYFTNTDAIIYSKNIEEGLEKIHNKDYDIDLMKTRQLQILSWAKKNLLLLSNTVEENINRLSKHLDFNL